MLDLQVSRLTTAFPAHFTKEEAGAIVARAYGYSKLDPDTYALSEPVPGLEVVRPYTEILKLDPTHQMIQFVRMALNISLPSDVDLRKGVPEREIVSAMLNFSNFDALLNYARSDPVDPNTTDKAMLAKFQKRFGHYAPIQYMLGRYLCEHTLMIQPDGEKAQRFVDQEVSLNPLNQTRVAILRIEPHGDLWLRAHMRKLGSFTGPLDANYESDARKALGDADALVAMLPAKAYYLTELVKANIAILTERSEDGRSLIVDRVPLRQSPADFDEAFRLASENNIHLVVIVKEPNSELWKRVGIRLIFGYPPGIQETHLEMDTMIGYASPYVGFKRGKMQYLYHSEASGPRFGAMDLIPDDLKTKTLIQRMKEAIRG